MYGQSDTFLVVDIFEDFRNICLKTYELDPTKFFSTPGLAWQAALKKTKVKLYLLTDIDILLMVEKVREDEDVALFIDMEKVMPNTWMMKINNGNIFNIGMWMVYMVGQYHKSFQ